MPKVKITEIDNTGNLQLNPITNVVYIPGAAAAKTEPLFCGSVNALDTYASEKSLTNDLSFKLARRLLQLGMQVIYQGFTTKGGTTTWQEGTFITDIIRKPKEGVEGFVLSFTASDEDFTIEGNGAKIVTLNQYPEIPGEGSSGEPTHLEFAVINGVAEIPEGTELFEGHAQTIKLDFVNNKVEYTLLGIEGANELDITPTDWELLSDKTLFDLRFLTVGAYTASTSQDMVKCATKRGDCVALIDHSNSLKSSSVSEIREYFSQFAISDITREGKFASGFTPWFKSEVKELGGSKVAPVEIPASFGYLLAYARSIQSNPDWYAVAGTFRGNIPELSGVTREYTSAEVEMLQGRAANAEVELDASGDNVGFAINPIAFVKGNGYLIWGNRTLTINSDIDQDGNGDLKASSFLNVRNICIDIVKTLYAAARKYTFEQNSNTLWLNFKHEIQPLLDRMVSGNGISSYTIEQIPTTKKARLSARISITPIEGVEDFELELYLEDSLEVIE